MLYGVSVLVVLPCLRTSTRTALSCNPIQWIVQALGHGPGVWLRKNKAMNVYNCGREYQFAEYSVLEELLDITWMGLRWK